MCAIAHVDVRGLWVLSYPVGFGDELWVLGHYLPIYHIHYFILNKKSGFSYFSGFPSVGTRGTHYNTKE